MEKEKIYRVFRLIPQKDFWGKPTRDLIPVSAVTVKATSVTQAMEFTLPYNIPEIGDLIRVEINVKHLGLGDHFMAVYETEVMGVS